MTHTSIGEGHPSVVNQGFLLWGMGVNFWALQDLGLRNPGFAMLAGSLLSALYIIPVLGFALGHLSRCVPGQTGVHGWMQMVILRICLAPAAIGGVCMVERMLFIMVPLAQLVVLWQVHPMLSIFAVAPTVTKQVCIVQMQRYVEATR